MTNVYLVSYEASGLPFLGPMIWFLVSNFLSWSSDFLEVRPVYPTCNPFSALITVATPVFAQFTLNFTITNLAFKEYMLYHGSKNFNTLERVLQYLVRGPLHLSPTFLWPCSGHLGYNSFWLCSVVRSYSPLLSHSSNPCSRPAVWDPSTQAAHWCHSGRSVPNTNSAKQVDRAEQWASQLLFGCIYSHHSLTVKPSQYQDDGADLSSQWFKRLF